jgi:hypothetical protein
LWALGKIVTRRRAETFTYSTDKTELANTIYKGSFHVLRVNANKFFRTSRIRPPKLPEKTASHGLTHKY